MDTLAQSLYQPLSFLIYTSIILIIITGVFLIQLLIDLRRVIKSLDSFLNATQGELEPLIREIKTTLVSINQISSNVTSQIDSMNQGIRKGAKSVLDAGAGIFSQVRVVGQIVGQSLKEGFYQLINPKK